MASSVDAPASPPNQSEDDLSPGAFLRSIRELSERREKEDIARYKKLEEEVARSRAERAARRVDRERSISPEKANSTNNLPTLGSHRDVNAFDSPRAVTTTPHSTVDMEGLGAGPPSPTKDIPVFKGFGSTQPSNAPSSTSPARASEPASPPAQSATSLARSGTLTWQRRPGSRGGSRPTSSVGPPSGGHVRNASMEQAEPSRDQIAASLGSRDPSWFKQTADRGIGSAAYRRSKDEAGASDIVPSARRGLPGMSPKVTAEPERQGSPVPSESIKSETNSRPSSIRDSGTSSSRYSTTTSGSTPSKPDLKSLIAEDELQAKASPMSERTSSVDGDQGSLGRTLTMSSSQSRLANTPDRPSSPTKGMGGFVQSAMMKRSDSVNKRWSAQPGTTLSRQNSLASVRSGYGLQGSHSMPRLEPTPSSREGSNEPSSRPSSSSSNLTSLTLTQGRDDNDGFVKPALPHHSRSKSVASTYTTNADDGATSPPSSPSKRFSPSKASWIESALTKPESPKPSTAKNSQPSWMAGLAKAKAERASAEPTPRSGTPTASQGEPARSGSPTKMTPFGQSMLRRSDSRDLASTPRSSTPLSVRESPSLTEKPAATPSDLPVQSAQTVTGGEVAAPAKAEPIAQPEAKPEPAQEQFKSAKPDIKPDIKPVPELANAPPATSSPRPKPELPAKPQTDFRNTLRSRAAPESKQQDTPEFLSKFGNLRRTQPEKYVAPDVLKNNITRGKADLTKTDGPVKTARRDELKESLLAKKEDWKKAKEEGRELPGQVHERKTSGTPMTPTKPEGLARREMLTRSDSSSNANSPEKEKKATPEGIARFKSLKEKPKVDPPPTKQTSIPAPEQARFEHLSKQASAPAMMEHKPATETSKLAARFNPGLAGLLARGPPSNEPSRSTSPAVPEMTTANTSSVPGDPAAGETLQDMRKGRAKGPKKRKAEATPTETEIAVNDETDRLDAATTTIPQVDGAPPETELPKLASVSKSRALPGSAASLMMASLKPSPKPDSQRSEQNRSEPLSSTSQSISSPSNTASAAATPNIPDFGGFKASKPALAAQKDDDKENAASSLPSVKSAASFWGRQASPKKPEAPPQIQLPSRQDEQAAMKSVGLLASSPGRSELSKGLSISVAKGRQDIVTPPASAGLPPKPSKSSRAVSGQLQEASPNKGPITRTPATEVERALAESFGSLPSSSESMTIDTATVLAQCAGGRNDETRNLRRTTQEVLPDGTLRSPPPQEEYTLFQEAVYVFTHTYMDEHDAKKMLVTVWSGNSSTDSAVQQAQSVAKRLSRDAVGSMPVQRLRQGYESTDFLHGVGGILVTRKGSREGAPKQYMLCGRKHLGSIVFDEVEFGVESLASGFVYLISYPVTLQETKLYLYKGAACSTEEISAARLTAMDLSETGEIIEVDGGAEFASFLKIFGPGTTKASIPKSSDMWRQKALAPDRFEVRLFRIQKAEQKTGLFASMFSRRPSWGNLSTSRSPSRDGQGVQVEVKHIFPFTQEDLEADGIYLLDAHSELYVLIGPLFTSETETVRNALLAQTLLFASEYARSSAAPSDRSIPAGRVLLHGVPQDIKVLFRHWDDGRGLWGTAGLMAGSKIYGGPEVQLLPLEDVRQAVCGQ